MLVSRLKGRRPRRLEAYLDALELARPDRKLQRRRALELSRLGAHVWACRGVGRPGSFHSKAAVVDRRCFYTGSANITGSASRSGPAVLGVLGRLAAQQVDCNRWVGG